ncbi:hypothetical protein NP233_g10621 [Leucocoprinus birnbaumii]|uniref:Uncharacterized protein n=1 Tax=Leucocoprinus birnbaumii TaxID=56174 RepID=A0AAD5VNY4_9AGAR|nr:hypothetical protein NP233_g10621 [Leucocoprinus birnbaumii]
MALYANPVLSIPKLPRGGTAHLAVAIQNLCLITLRAPSPFPAMLFLLLTAAASQHASSIPVADSTSGQINDFGSQLLTRSVVPFPTMPDNGAPFNPAHYRTTQQIVLSCLVTIFACTWVSMHPNVPDPDNTGWQNLLSRVRTMFFALVGPEFVVIWALRQRLGAARHMEEYNLRIGLKPRPFSLLQCAMDWFRVPQGGFTPLKSVEPGWTLTHGFLLEMQGLVQLNQNGEPEGGDPYFEDRPGIVSTVDHLHGHHFTMSENEINDKSKGDAFTKFVVVIQTSWFILQCVARWVQRLYVSELEIITLAFAVLNIITYALWWNKPQNMRVAIPIHIVGNPSHTGFARVADGKEEDDCEVIEIAHPSEDRSDTQASAEKSGSGVGSERLGRCWSLICLFFNTYLYFIQAVIQPINILPAFCLMMGDNGLVFKASPSVRATFYSSNQGTAERKVSSAIGLVGALFGGVHLIPIWLCSFPSDTERIMWMSGSIWMTIQPMMFSRVLSAWFYVGGPLPQPWDDILVQIPHTIGFVQYVICRLILMGLAFSSLRGLPPGAYLNIEWSTFFPHV